MIRLLSFLVFFGASAIVLADPLYKWVEPDGSITFSVKPPAAGISYETVSTSSSKQTITQKAPESVQSESTPALQQALPTTGQSVAPTQRLAPQQSPQTTAAQPRIQSSSGNQSDLTSYVENRSSNVMGTAADNAGNEVQNSAGRSAALSAKSRKQRQCEDLKKRVISLEGRLKTRLTPDDMDNTVVHMARYQRSYDQHCVQ